jgi:chemotaxis signal transduction protein
MLVLTFQVGTERLALDTRCIEAVVPHVPLRAVAGGPPWLAGIFVYHGAIVPVMDLHRLVGAGDCPPHLSSRIILATDPADKGRLVGLLAAQVDNLQEVKATTTTSFTSSGRADLGPVLADGTDIVRLLDLGRLLPDSARRLLAVTQEQPA